MSFNNNNGENPPLTEEDNEKIEKLKQRIFDLILKETEENFDGKIGHPMAALWGAGISLSCFSVIVLGCDKNTISTSFPLMKEMFNQECSKMQKLFSKYNIHEPPLEKDKLSGLNLELSPSEFGGSTPDASTKH